MSSQTLMARKMLSIVKGIDKKVPQFTGINSAAICHVERCYRTQKKLLWSNLFNPIGLFSMGLCSKVTLINQWLFSPLTFSVQESLFLFSFFSLYISLFYYNFNLCNCRKCIRYYAFGLVKPNSIHKFKNLRKFKALLINFKMYMKLVQYRYTYTVDSKSKAIYFNNFMNFSQKFVWKFIVYV